MAMAVLLSAVFVVGAGARRAVGSGPFFRPAVLASWCVAATAALGMPTEAPV